MGKVSRKGVVCLSCPRLQIPNLDRTGCRSCNSDEYYKHNNGAGRPTCVRCSPPLEVHEDRGSCVCGKGMYNATETTLRCVNDEFGKMARLAFSAC